METTHGIPQVCQNTVQGISNATIEAAQPKSEQVVIVNGEAIYDCFGRVRVNYRGKLGWCYLTHMEYDGDVA